MCLHHTLTDTLVAPCRGAGGTFFTERSVKLVDPQLTFAVCPSSLTPARAEELAKVMPEFRVVPAQHRVTWYWVDMCSAQSVRWGGASRSRMIVLLCGCCSSCGHAASAWEVHAMHGGATSQSCVSSQQRKPVHHGMLGQQAHSSEITDHVAASSSVPCSSASHDQPAWLDESPGHIHRPAGCPSGAPWCCSARCPTRCPAPPSSACIWASQAWCARTRPSCRTSSRPWVSWGEGCSAARAARAASWAASCWSGT